MTVVMSAEFQRCSGHLRGCDRMYCARSRLADQVLKPVVPSSIVVRDSIRVVFAYPGYTMREVAFSNGQRYVR